MENDNKLSDVSAIWSMLEDLWDLFRAQLEPEIEIPNWASAISANDSVKGAIETFLKLELGNDLSIEQPEQPERSEENE